MSTTESIKRFYKDVRVESIGGSYEVCLDGKPVRTPHGNDLLSKNKNLIGAVADEWSAQTDSIRRETMPLTALLSTAIDAGEESRSDWRDETLSYLKTDLLCYRADKPEQLVQQQNEIWDFYLAWLKDEFGAALISTAGISAVKQSDDAVDIIRSQLDGMDALMSLAIQKATKITGSAVLALALMKDVKPVEDIFRASRLDEHFQETKWGVDAEAKDRERAILNEFIAVANFMRLLEKP